MEHQIVEGLAPRNRVGSAGVAQMVPRLNMLGLDTGTAGVGLLGARLGAGASDGDAQAP